MTERKVLNKYYPQDYDYRKIPRLRRDRNAQWVQRVMAPFNMRCNTCGHYIYRGTKFNARRETAQGETYLGLKIFRFYIRCPMCCADISFKTDIENLDYAIEQGATRNFEAVKLMAAEDKRKQEEIAAEEANNPMAVLENRTKDSRREMEIMENLEELKERADANAQTDLNDLIGDSLEKQHKLLAQILLKQEEEDESFINSLYETTTDGIRIKRIVPSDDVTLDEDDCDSLPNLISSSSFTHLSATDKLVPSSCSQPSAAKLVKLEPQSSKSCSKPPKNSLASMVKVKPKVKPPGQIADDISNKRSGISSKAPVSDVDASQVSSENVETSLFKPLTSKPATGVKTSPENNPSSTSISLVSTYSDSSSGDEI